MWITSGWLFLLHLLLSQTFANLLNILLSSVTLLPISLRGSFTASESPLKSEGHRVTGLPSRMSFGLPFTTCLTVCFGACWSCLCAAEHVLLAGSCFFRVSKCLICFSSAICNGNVDVDVIITYNKLTIGKTTG